MRALFNLGKATVTMMRMIAMTINNSINEKPLCRRLRIEISNPLPLYDAWGGLNVQEAGLHHRGARQRFDELRLSGGSRASAAGQLYAMGGVEHHRPAQIAHDLETAHVHHQVVVVAE